MSIKYPPSEARNAHGTALDTVLNGEVSGALSDTYKKLLRLKAMCPEIWEPIFDKLDNHCKNFLNGLDEYLEVTPKEIWNEFSYYTGNTRGAIKIVGDAYPRKDIEFDKEEWFRPKTLKNLVEKKIVVTYYRKKKDEFVTKKYTYAPGKVEVQITGEDYAPRIPNPEHGGGNIDMLIAAFEEIRDAKATAILKKKGIIK